MKILKLRHPQLITRSSKLRRRGVQIFLGALISLTSLVSLSFAEDLTLMGRIKDGSGAPISGARVRAKGPMSSKAVTNARGVYQLKLKKAGQYTLTVSAKGFKNKKISVKVKGPMTRRDIRLSRLKNSKKIGLGSVAGSVGDSSPQSARQGIGGLNSGRSLQSKGEGRKSKSRMKRRTRRPPQRKRARRPSPKPMSSVSAKQPLKIARPIRASQDSDDAQKDNYAHRDENAFKDPKVNPLSTFSIDVDTASYANMRRFIFDGRRPPKGAIRLEEMINYFNYDYISPTEDDPHPFKVHTELAPAPWAPHHRLFHIGLQGRRIDRSKLPPSNLVFLIDVSGSMHGPDRLPLLKQAFSLLASTLRPIDKVSIVVYAGAAGVVLPTTTGDHRRTIIDAFSKLRAGGSTAGGAGIKLAYQIAKDEFVKGGNNRVILATDGDFNVGVSSQSGLVKMIERERKSGVFLTVLGFGRGNYKDKHMSMLAEKGNGNHAYIDSLLEAQKVLVSEMGGTLFTIAKDVKLQLEFNPSKVKEYRLIGYESRVLAAKDFNDDKKDAGELGAGHSVTALYELIPSGGAAVGAGVDSLKYQERAPSTSEEWLTVKLRYKAPDGDKSTLLSQTHTDERPTWAEASENYRLSAGIAAFGMTLQGSKYKGDSSWAMIKQLVSGALGQDSQGYRAELLELIKRAETVIK